jgi:hypothetical protein
MALFVWVAMRYKYKRELLEVEHPELEIAGRGSLGIGRSCREAAATDVRLLARKPIWRGKEINCRQPTKLRVGSKF